MALSECYQLIVKQELQGRSVENVFFYQAQGVGGSAADLRNAFFETISVAMRNLQSQALVWSSIDTTNLGDETDFEKFPFVVTGLAGAGDTFPAHDAVGYTLNPITRAVRPGSKRIAGVLEQVVLNGVFTDPTYVGQIESFRILLDDPLVGAEGTYDPVIVKRIKTLKPDTNPPQYKYTLPKVGDPYVVGLVKSANANPRVTTQNSRKH